MRRQLLILFLLSIGGLRCAVALPVFESGPVRPLALSPSGTRLFVVNTADHRLEIFSVDGSGLRFIDSVAVGLEPVALAAYSETEVWVVNHLSDSVSVVDVGAIPPRVVRTLLVGDEPRDIVFGGPQANGKFARAFITTARRGQNLPPYLEPKLSTPGTPRALVWVFDANGLDGNPEGTPEKILELFGDTPRALAVSPDGRTVYAAVFHSGNQTTSVAEGAVCNGGATAGTCALDGIQVASGLPNGSVPGGLPAPNQNFQGIAGPETGLIVKLNRNSGVWEDQLGRNWSNAVRFNLPDLDVFRIDAAATPPVQTAAFAHVGTILLNMLVNPTNGKLYVTNTDANNEIRFEGPGNAASSVRGHLHESRITVIDGSSVLPRHLNKHISALPQGYRTKPMPAAVKAASLATPLGMALGSDGTLYVAAFGSSAIGTLDAAALENDTFTPSAAAQIAVSGGGPAGLVLDESRSRLYVLTRFDNAVKVIDTAARAEIAQYPLHTSEPSEVTAGRHFLYDARNTSSNGEASCAGCHVFGDFDSLGWDLGNPDAGVVPNPNPTGPIGGPQPFHPLKGPMTTQTLRGMAHHGPMHWRGDRTGGQFPGDPAARDEELAFAAFNVAFDGLLGRDEGKLSESEMQAFARFALAIRMPPNPVRRLDNQLTDAQERGRDVYLNRPGTDAIASCTQCHKLDAAQGFFGTGGETTFDNEPQQFKVAQLRNAYQKVGMFGMPQVGFVNLPVDNTLPQGDQVRGFGFLHDGSIARLIDFLHASVFGFDDGTRSDLEQFILAFDTTYAPVVGQQVTLTPGNGAAAAPRIDLFLQRAAAPFTLAEQPGATECELIVKGTVDGEARGYLFTAGKFQSDRGAETALSDSQLRALVGVTSPGLTYTCAPPGAGARLGLDRDGDSFFDRDELDAGSDPANPDDTPHGQPTPTASVAPTVTPTASPLPEFCPGDCAADGAVTIDDLIIAVTIALGERSTADCSPADLDFDGVVTIDEIIQAVNAALSFCGGV